MGENFEINDWIKYNYLQNTESARERIVMKSQFKCHIIEILITYISNTNYSAQVQIRNESNDRTH